MDGEHGTQKLHQGAGAASQPSPCPPLLLASSSSAASSSTPNSLSSSAGTPASSASTTTTTTTSSENVEAEAGHIYQPGTKAEVRLVYRIKKGPGAGRHQKSFSISRYGVQGAWDQAEAARQYINAHGTLPPHFVVQSLPSKSNSSTSASQKGRRGPASSTAASSATAGYTTGSSSSGASSAAGGAASANSTSSSQGDGGSRVKGAGGGASGGGRSGGRGGTSSSKGGGDGAEKKGRSNASPADTGGTGGFLSCGGGRGARGRAAASRAAPLVGFPSPTSNGASAHNVYLNLQGRGILPTGLRGMVHPYVFLASGGAGAAPIAGGGTVSSARTRMAGDEAQRVGAQAPPFIGILPNVLNSAVVAPGGGGVVKGLPLPSAPSAAPTAAAGATSASCSTSGGVKTAVSSALPTASVAPTGNASGGSPAASSSGASTVVTQQTAGGSNNHASTQAVAVGRESEVLQAGLTEGGCIRLLLPFSALSRTVMMPQGGTTATIIVPETKILVQPGTVVIAAGATGAAGGVCAMPVGGSGGSPTCTSSTTAGGGSNVDDESHASSEASGSTSTSPVSSRGAGGAAGVVGDNASPEQTAGLTGVAAIEAGGGGGALSTSAGFRSTDSAAAALPVSDGAAAVEVTRPAEGMQEKDEGDVSSGLEASESTSAAGDNDLKRPLPAEEALPFSRPPGRDTLWLLPLVDSCDSAVLGTETSGGDGTAATAVSGREGGDKGEATTDRNPAAWVVESSSLLSAAAGLTEVTFLSSPVPSPPGSPPSVRRPGFAEASPGSGTGRVRPFKRRCLDVSPLFLCSGSPPTIGTGDASCSSANSGHTEHGSSLCTRSSSLDTRSCNGVSSTGSSLTFLLSSPPSSDYRRGTFAGFASPLPSGSKGSASGETFPALPPPLASFRSPDITAQQMGRRSREPSRSESPDSSGGNEESTRKANTDSKEDRSDTAACDKKESNDGQVSCKGEKTTSGTTSALASLSSRVPEMFASPSSTVSGKQQERGSARLENQQYDMTGALAAGSSSVSASPSLAPSSISPFFAFSPFSALPRPSPPCGPSSFPGVGGAASPKTASACNNRRLVLLPAERCTFSASPLDDQSTPQLFTNSNPPVFSEALSTSPGLFALSSPSVTSSGLLEPPHSSPSRGPSPVGQSNESASSASLVSQGSASALGDVAESALKPGLDLHDTTDGVTSDGLTEEDKPEDAPVSGPSPLLLSAGVGQLPMDESCAAAELGESRAGDSREQDPPPQAAAASPVQPEPGGRGGSPSAGSEKSSAFLGLDRSSRVQSVLASLVAEGGLMGTCISSRVGDKASSSEGQQEDRVFGGKGTANSPAVQTVATAARASA